MQSGKINFYKVRGIGEIISTMADFIRENFQSFVRCMLYTTGPFLLIMLLVFTLLQYSMGKSMINGIGASFYLYNFLVIVAGIFSASVFLTGIYQYVILYMQKEADEGITVAELWQSIRQNYMIVLKTLIGLVLFIGAIYFAMVIAVVIAVAIGTGFSTLFSSLMNPVVMVLLSILVVIAFIGGLLYVFSPLALIFNVRLIEKLRFGQSVSRCFQLASGNRWKIVGVIFICFVIQMMAMTVAMIPFILVTAISGSDFIEKGPVGFEEASVWMIVMSIVFMLIGYFGYAINIIAITLQYGSIREEKEAVSLQNRIEEFGADQEERSSDTNDESYKA